MVAAKFTRAWTGLITAWKVFSLCNSLMHQSNEQIWWMISAAAQQLLKKRNPLFVPVSCLYWFVSVTFCEGLSWDAPKSNWYWRVEVGENAKQLCRFSLNFSLQQILFPLSWHLSVLQLLCISWNTAPYWPHWAGNKWWFWTAPVTARLVVLDTFVLMFLSSFKFPVFVTNTSSALLQSQKEEEVEAPEMTGDVTFWSWSFLSPFCLWLHNFLLWTVAKSVYRNPEDF